MFIVTKDGNRVELDNGSKVIDFANKIGLTSKTVAAEVNNEVVDVTRTLSDSDTVTLITTTDPMALEILRHSTAHVLAYALKNLNVATKFAIGPSIESGFYYDISSSKSYSVDDLEMIEKEMRKIVTQKIEFERIEMSVAEARELFKDEPFKLEILEELEGTVSIYKLGDFFDLCIGPHIPNTSFIKENAFKLTNVAGAYWRGDSSNEMLQRIYGTSFFSKKELDEHLKMLEEAALRDHRKLGPELGLFHLDDEAPGSVFWLKNGTILYNNVKNYITSVIERNGYFLVQTPQLLKKTLWETSGHWEKFRENMFIVNEDGIAAEDDEKTMAIKPMNCPGHMIIYKTGHVKSYKDMPMRMAEFGMCHRNEPSGSLHGLLRLRAFIQDDGHIFCTRDQIISETQNVCSMIKEIYSKFGFNDIAIKFSDRPEKRAGSDEIWDIAESSLLEAADASGLDYTINKGEGAFYGPKLEFVLKDCLGRDWQCGTLQADFVLPERFDIHYTASDGSRQRPVMLHRALVGSMERFIGVLIENYGGRFPFWLAPVQVAVASITEDSADYAKSIASSLDGNFRTVLDIDNEKINYKIRKHSVQKVPVIIIVGGKERDEGKVSIRKLGSTDTETISKDSLIDYLNDLKA